MKTFRFHCVLNIFNIPITHATAFLLQNILIFEVCRVKATRVPNSEVIKIQQKMPLNMQNQLGIFKFGYICPMKDFKYYSGLVHKVTSQGHITDFIFLLFHIYSQH